MGGLREKMPVTYYTFLAGSLALAGIFPFAGFWSKDEVLYETLIHGLGGSPLLLLAYGLGLLAVPVTAFYTFRMVLLTFHGEPRTETAEDPHGVGWNVKLPLVVLGTLAVVTGLVNMVPVEKLFGIGGIDYLHQWLDGDGVGGISSLTAHHYEELLSYDAAFVGGGETATVAVGVAASLGLALVGAGAAIALYRGPDPEEHTAKLGGARNLLAHNYYQDEYQVWLAEGLTLPLSRAADAFDAGIIDGVVNGVSSVSLFSGGRIRRIQTGIVSNYAALLTLGLVALLAVVGLLRGWF